VNGGRPRITGRGADIVSAKIYPLDPLGRAQSATMNALSFGANNGAWGRHVRVGNSASTGWLSRRKTGPRQIFPKPAGRAMSRPIQSSTGTDRNRGSSPVSPQLSAMRRLIG
jgi:hypothetical protein